MTAAAGKSRVESRRKRSGPVGGSQSGRNGGKVEAKRIPSDERWSGQRYGGGGGERGVVVGSAPGAGAAPSGANDDGARTALKTVVVNPAVLPRLYVIAAAIK